MLARAQHCTVARRQLLKRGLTAEQIARRLADGRLTPLHRGVYLAAPLPTEFTAAQAALLACGERAVLSHLTSAWIWRLYGACMIPISVTVPPNRRLERPAVRVAYRDLTPDDLRWRYGMPITSPPRTILDCASRITDPYELEAMVAEASFRGISSEAELASQLQRNPGARGIRSLRRVLDLPGGPQRTRNDGERAVLRFLRRHGFRGFRANHRFHGYELDFVWPELRFALEFDGWDGHKGRAAFERDRLKIATLQSVGVEVMPLTGRQLRDDPEGVAHRLRATLIRRQGEVAASS